MRRTRSPKRLSLPATLAVAVVGVASASTIAIVSCGGDDSPPQDCTVQGECPTDGRVCITPDTFELCCPVCPVDNACPDGCVLDLPPV